MTMNCISNRQTFVTRQTFVIVNLNRQTFLTQTALSVVIKDPCLFLKT